MAKLQCSFHLVSNNLGYENAICRRCSVRSMQDGKKRH
ncbi:hypothetical protein DWUX_2098 [Desulfovibrio diazotrophicus]|nr:hypothetical protein DWUX_2098 [Desulfovibrio diazotrophicus]